MRSTLALLSCIVASQPYICVRIRKSQLGTQLKLLFYCIELYLVKYKPSVNNRVTYLSHQLSLHFHNLSGDEPVLGGKYGTFLTVVTSTILTYKMMGDSSNIYENK
jgi:hypothetical protein